MQPAHPVELWLGSNMLAYGKKGWQYPVRDPFNAEKVFGNFIFDNGVLLSSSGREHFVQIEGKLYSHILDLKTGYPLPDFSSLVVYFPHLESENFMSSAMLAVMGREKAFSLLSGMKGTSAVWIDGSGKETLFTNKDSGARWEKTTKLF
jgi:thiamine biosynthesis lipoprotein